jgi:pimeloyl-ACP methyl ester carboxylesterase
MPIRPALLRAAATAAIVFAATTSAFGADPTPDETYDAAGAWLCRPGRTDLCSTDQTVTSITADGTKSIVTLKADPNAPIDCFYVYPTISQDPNSNSSLKAGPGEERAVRQQFAPFASVCRPFAPMYRQVTLAGLMRVMRNEGSVDRELAVEDVRAAWRHYLRNDNKGRGVVLVGHSQGGAMLTELLKRDIEGKPAEKLVVSALLPGFNLIVPWGADGQPLRSMLVRTANLLGQPADQLDWQQMVAGTETAFVDLPGMLKAQCMKDGQNNYLSLTVDASSRGNRAPDIPGDLVAQGRKWDDWGLHLVDMNIAMGNLLDLLKRQGRPGLVRSRSGARAAAGLDQKK